MSTKIDADKAFLGLGPLKHDVFQPLGHVRRGIFRRPIVRRLSHRSSYDESHFPGGRPGWWGVVDVVVVIRRFAGGVFPVPRPGSPSSRLLHSLPARALPRVVEEDRDAAAPGAQVRRRRDRGNRTAHLQVAG